MCKLYTLDLEGNCLLDGVPEVVSCIDINLKKSLLGVVRSKDVTALQLCNRRQSTD